MFRNIQERLIVGWGLVFIGTLTAVFLYQVGESIIGPSDEFFLSDSDRKKVPFEVFKYSLFTVAIGAISVIYKYYIDELETRRAARSEHAEETRKFRADIIEIYSGFKSIRREIIARSNFVEGQKIDISVDQFFKLYSVFNSLQHRVETLEWRLDMTQKFLGDDQDAVINYIRVIEKFTGSVGRDARAFNYLSPQSNITINPGNDLFKFLQRNVSERRAEKNRNLIQSKVNREFFSVMYELRSVLHTRVRQFDKE